MCSKHSLLTSRTLPTSGFFNFLLLSCIKPLGKAWARKLICKRYISYLWINTLDFLWMETALKMNLWSELALLWGRQCPWHYIQFVLGFMYSLLVSPFFFFFSLACSFPGGGEISPLFLVACSGFSRSVPRSLSHIFLWHNCKKRNPLSGRIWQEEQRMSPSESNFFGFQLAKCQGPYFRLKLFRFWISRWSGHTLPMTSVTY